MAYRDYTGYQMPSQGEHLLIVTDEKKLKQRAYIIEGDVETFLNEYAQQIGAVVERKNNLIIDTGTFTFPDGTQLYFAVFV